MIFHDLDSLRRPKTRLILHAPLILYGNGEALRIELAIGQHHDSRSPGPHPGPGPGRDPVPGPDPSPDQGPFIVDLRTDRAEIKKRC